MILVIGSTGHVGKELVPQLLQSGQQLRVLVRDEQKVAHLDPSIERAYGKSERSGVAYRCYARREAGLSCNTHNPARCKCAGGCQTNRRQAHREAFHNGSDGA